jgi:hypothetical protein
MDVKLKLELRLLAPVVADGDSSSLSAVIASELVL